MCESLDVAPVGSARCCIPRRRVPALRATSGSLVIDTCPTWQEAPSLADQMGRPNLSGGRVAFLALYWRIRWHACRVSSCCPAPSGPSRRPVRPSGLLMEVVKNAGQGMPGAPSNIVVARELRKNTTPMRTWACPKRSWATPGCRTNAARHTFRPSPLRGALRHKHRPIRYGAKKP